MPCNFHLRALAKHVKDGIKAAGGTPMEFNTVAISDGITMGTSGMKTSLVSREVVADSIELVTLGHLFDAVICLCACDKTIPGTVMALARLDVPGVMLYGGSIPPGHYKGRDITIMDVFEAVGANAAGKITDQDLADIEAAASPGAGACGGQYTANTMAMAFEMMGISPIGPSLTPAQDATKSDHAYAAGELVMDVLRRGQKPCDLITRESLENAILAVAASGGSTNAVLHLLAVAREAGVPLDIDDFDRIAESSPSLCDLKPGGRFVATDLHAAGGTAVLAKRLKELGLLHEDAPTVTGKSIGQHADEAQEAPGQEVIRPLDNPIKKTGGIAILRGNLAPEGSVVKLSGHERRHHSGPARVFEGEEASDGRRHHRPDQPGRRRRDPQRGPRRRPRHARDARRHRRDRGGGARRHRRADHRRPLLRRHARLHGRPRRPRGGARRPDRGRPRGRHDHDRRRQPPDRPRHPRRRDRAAPRRLRAARRRRSPAACWRSTPRRSRAPPRARSRSPAPGAHGGAGDASRRSARDELGQQLVEARGALEHREVARVVEHLGRALSPISRSNSYASSTGIRMSLRPQTISVGISISGSRSRNE